MIYLIFYASVMCSLVLLREFRQHSNLDRFLVAERKVEGIVGSMSIAASWIWAPAILVSTQTGFRWGYAGLLWFCIPNMLALIIFAPLAAKVRKRIPQGYNYIEYICKGAPSFVYLQLILQLVMQLLIFALQLVAGAELLGSLTNSPYSWMVIGMALTPFCYTFFSGLRTSVFTDAFQYIIIAGSAIALLLFFPDPSANVKRHTFEPFDKNLLLEFGLSSALGLLVAIFADHQQWQRAFAIREGKLVQTFYLAAGFHGLVTISLGTLGYLIFSSGFQPAQLQLVGFEYVQSHYLTIFISIYVVMALCALLSTLDSALCAFSSLVMCQVFSTNRSLKDGRMLMLILASTGTAIALLRPSVITLWFIACTIRLSSFFPTVASIQGTREPSRYYTLSTILALVIGGSFFGYGVWQADTFFRTIGMLSTLFISGVVLLLAAVFCRTKQLQEE